MIFTQAAADSWGGGGPVLKVVKKMLQWVIKASRIYVNEIAGQRFTIV